MVVNSGDSDGSDETDAEIEAIGEDHEANSSVANDASDEFDAQIEAANENESNVSGIHLTIPHNFFFS